MNEEAAELSPREVGQALRLSGTTIRAWLERDPPPGARRTPGGHWRVPESALDELAAALGQCRGRRANHALDTTKALGTRPAPRHETDEPVTDAYQRQSSPPS